MRLIYFFVECIHKITTLKLCTPELSIRLVTLPFLVAALFKQNGNNVITIQSSYRLTKPSSLSLRFKTCFSVTNPLHLWMNWCHVWTIEAALEFLVTYAACVASLRMANCASKLWCSADDKRNMRVAGIKDLSQYSWLAAELALGACCKAWDCMCKCGLSYSVRMFWLSNRLTDFGNVSYDNSILTVAG